MRAITVAVGAVTMFSQFVSREWISCGVVLSRCTSCAARVRAVSADFRSFSANLRSPTLGASSSNCEGATSRSTHALHHIATIMGISEAVPGSWRTQC